MAEDTNKTAYIRFKREDNSLKYIAKVFNDLPYEITKVQYNAIVKALSKVEWANTDENEVSIISKIIGSNLEPVE